MKLTVAESNQVNLNVVRLKLMRNRTVTMTIEFADAFIANQRAAFAETIEAEESQGF